jgi:hypothetical protein
MLTLLPYAFFACFAFNAFFLLLLIMTTERNEPTTAEPRRIRMTGMRIAQTLGGKRLWRGCSSSTNGYDAVSLVTKHVYILHTINKAHTV